MPRMKSIDYLDKVRRWLDDASQNREMLYSLKLTDKYTDAPIISVEKFLKMLGLPPSGRSILREHCKVELEQMTELMRSEGLIKPNISANNLNLINSLKNLLRRMEADPTLLERVQIYRNSVQASRLIHAFPEHELSLSIAYPRGKEAADYFKNVFAVRVMELLKDSGTYVYTDNKPAAEPEPFDRLETFIAKFMEARDCSNVSSLSGFEGLLKEPFDVIYYLCALGSRTVSGASSIGNFSATYQHLKAFLSSQGFLGTESVHIALDEYVSLKFRAYLEDYVATGELSPSYASTMLSCFQLSLDRLSELDGGRDFSYIKASGFDLRGRTTDTYKPYPKAHRDIVADVLNKEIQRVWDRHSTPYVKTTTGCTFVKQIAGGVRIDGELCTEQNLRWFFDQKLGAERFTFNDLSSVKGVANDALFYKALQKYRQRHSGAHSRLEDLYEAWGVPRDVYREELFPFYMRLLQVTGMNPISALDLDIDAFESEHPATLRPCLRYWKARSTGAKDLHLDIFNSEITWLSKSQAREVSDIVDKVKALTESVRSRLPDDHKFKNLLFIAAGKPPKGYGQVKRLYESGYERIRAHFENRYLDELIDVDTGEVITLVGTRFRSSIVSAMIEAGVSIREIQLMLGHGSITTTLSYLDRMDFNQQARAKIQEKLQSIYDNAWVPKEPENVPREEQYRGEIIFKTPLGGCANIFNPPDFIKNSKSYDGGACSNFNKCLSCENVIITRAHLPDLFALLRDYQTAWQHGTVAATPYGTVIRENIEILESILGDESEFDKTELEEAQRLARYIDSTVKIDGVAV
ncbi:site-specific integrase [Marinobacter sp. BW6]|uniref:site-specific integrase n=1 Tax=Marinobacter sp. BW6 TaxID=2592624 RepID=UPI0011DE9750|nr:site-specific integrase [Marinobacter sp. BW6]TYC59510.1 site-specific integrase [Marinobacter sp. BW6]